MTDSVIPSVGGNSDGYILGRIIEFAGGSSGWIQESSTAKLADNDSRLNQSNVPLNAFGESHSSSSFDVTIDTGEAFIGGSWLARDTTTTVTLSSSTTGQKVYVGWDADATETVIIGKSGAFASQDPKLHIWTFDTDGSGVTSATDKRSIGQQQDLGKVDIDADSTIARYILDELNSSFGTAGQSSNEVLRVPGNSTDLVMSVQDGTGKMNLAYNASQYDSGDGNGTTWRYIISNEPAYRISMESGGITFYGAAGGTSGDPISFNSIQVEQAGGIADGSTTIWDDANQEVPKAQLGGPASSLTSHPLPPADIDDGSGSGLDSDTVDGFHATDLQGGEWTQIDTHEDTDGTTTISYDTGTLSTTYEHYKLRFTFSNYAADGSFNEIRMRVNNDSSSNYNTMFKSTSSEIDTRRGKNAWFDIGKVVDQGEIGHGEVILRGDVANASSGNQWPAITVDAHGNPDTFQADGGHFQVSDTSINSIQAFTESKATGKLKLLGATL